MEVDVKWLLLLFIVGCDWESRNRKGLIPHIDYENQIICYTFFQRAVSCIDLTLRGEPPIAPDTTDYGMK